MPDSSRVIIVGGDAGSRRRLRQRLDGMPVQIQERDADYNPEWNNVDPEELKRLRDSFSDARRLRQLADAMPAFIAYVDRNERFTLVNKHYRDVFARRDDELVGRKVAEVIGEESYARVRPHMEVALRGERLRVDEKMETPTAGLRDFDVTYIPDLQASGEVNGYFLLARDVTDRLTAERALRESEARLRESEKRRTEYLAMLGHELRNPLAAIRNATELVKTAVHDPEKVARAADILERQAMHTSGLVDGLLEVARISQGKVVIDKQTVDLSELLAGVLEDRRDGIHRRRLQLRREIPSEPLWISADRVRLVQVIDNIVGNAIKFTPAGGEIAVSVQVEGTEARVEIADTGVGIAPDRLQRIFEPFHQEEQPSDRDRGGLGLGLAVAKGLMDLHGAEIVALSDGPGRGSRFRLTLALAKAPQSAQRRQREDEAAALSILLVEDNPDAGQILRDLLEIEGHSPVLMDNASDALAWMDTQNPDVVICDIGLPGMNGYEFARTLRADSRFESMLLVALTGYGQPEDRERAVTAGFDAHLVKPVGLKALKQAIIGPH